MPSPPLDPLAPLRARLERPARFDVVGVGEASWDEVWLLPSVPAWGGKARASGVEALGGGQVATAMVAAARLGLRAAWHGTVGDDEAGRAIVEELVGEGVDVEGARLVPGARSHRAAIVVDGEADRTVLFHDDERCRMRAVDVDRALSASGRLLHVDGNELPASIAAAEAARAADRVVSCDLERVEAETGALLRHVDVCVASAAFATALTGEADLERALRTVCEAGPSLAVATLGARGAAAWDGARFVLVPAAPTPLLVDTTACGDTFRAALAAALLDGADAEAALAWANAAAALKTRALGRRGCPTRDEVDRHARAALVAPRTPLEPSSLR